MSTTDRTATCATPERSGALVVLFLAALAACEGDRGPAGPSGGGGPGTDPVDPVPTEYAPGEPVPELVARITALSGASGPGGEFLPGDVLTVEFALEQAGGEPWTLAELTAGAALVSGPTFNYQRVLPADETVRARATETGAGLFRFTFAEPLPATYPAPYNDSPTFGPNAGELTGRDLLDGTYTVGLSFTWGYEVDGVDFVRAGEATLDFLVGTGAGALAPRAVTSAEHCDRCHGALQAHDGRYRKFELCVLCHTSGAEDANLPDVAGGTPGVLVDSRVLFHRIHAGRFLPSVNGVATLTNGNRNYAATPAPLRYARTDGIVRDFSHVGFPVMPHRNAPMPRDTGYDALTPDAQRQEDVVRSMPARCDVCHGDPDGAGPLEPPAQASLIHVPKRRACAACHDDVVFSRPYRSNGQVMPQQPNDNGCTSCHDPRFPGDLSSVTAHVHPLDDPAFDDGLNVALTAASEGGAHDGDGTLDPGEQVVLAFTLTDDAGAEVAPNDLDELRVVLAGPNTNFQVLYDAAVPRGLVSGAPPFQLTLPERIELEHVGDSTAGLDVFQSRRSPHLRTAGVTTDVLVRTSTSGGASVLTTGAGRHAVRVDVLAGTDFARGDLVVLDDGVPGREEYLRVELVELVAGGARLWFAGPGHADFVPGLRADHAAGAAVLEVQVIGRSAPVHYTLDQATGTLTEVAEFGAGNAVLASYTTPYVLPAAYPQAPNGSDELDDAQGKWTGLPLVGGTYRAALAAARDLEFRLGTSITRYRSSSPGATISFLVGDALAPEPYTRITDGASCNECHLELAYHGDLYRGFDTCILCHGASGTEDRPRSVSANAPETPGRSVEFRTLLHKIHRGRELADEGYSVVGAGPAPFPDDFTTRAYHGFATFPAFPGRTLACARCHGEGNPDALLPAAREHPDAQLRPLQIWRPVCAGCHDAPAVTAHVASNTAPDGGEACAICHDPGEFEDARAVHAALLEPR